MTQSVKISDEDYKIIETIAKKERRSRKTILSFAVQNYGKAKKILKGN
jgi:predicted transcriptional regulator